MLYIEYKCTNYQYFVLAFRACAARFMGISWIVMNKPACFYGNPIRLWAFEAIGYTQHHLCRQPHEKMATPGGFSLLCWVDTINIKTNPNDIVLLAGVLSCQTPTSGGIGGLRTATNPLYINYLLFMQNSLYNNC